MISNAFLGSLAADEVTEEIANALKAYEAGEYSAASVSLQQANSIVMEKKSAAIAKALPDTVGEWKGGEVENNGAGLAVFGGGGTMLERKYSKGDLTMAVTLMVDSPMVMQYVGMLNNPAMATAMGLKRRKVGENVALFNPKENSLNMIIENRFMIQINGSQGKEDNIMEIAGGIDTEVLTGLK